MMEFTLTRVVLGVCAVVLMAAVMAPVGELYDDREDAGMQGQCDGIAEMIDVYYGSEIDVMTLSMNTVIPSGTWTVTINGNTVLMTDGTSEYISVCSVPVATEGSYTGNDVVMFTKTDGGVNASLLSL